MAPFPFLDLPPEIRSKIYHQIVVSPYPIPLNHEQDFRSNFDPDQDRYLPTFPHSLLLTTSQIYHEIRPIYFTTNKFVFVLIRRNDFLIHTILDPSFRDNLFQIRCLTVKIRRWGSRDFFVKKLVPVLEECILKGRLRVLEVVVRDGDLARQEGRNLEALRRLLGDRDLEVGRLWSSDGLGPKCDGDENEGEMVDITSRLQL